MMVAFPTVLNDDSSHVLTSSTSPQTSFPPIPLHGRESEDVFRRDCV